MQLERKVVLEAVNVAGDFGLSNFFECVESLILIGSC